MLMNDIMEVLLCAQLEPGVSYHFREKKKYRDIKNSYDDRRDESGGFLSGTFMEKQKKKKTKKKTMWLCT